MKTKQWNTAAVIILTMVALMVMPGILTGQTVQKLQLAEIHPLDFPTTQGDLEFARLVKERTKGRIEIEVVASGGLGNEKEAIEMVKAGKLAFARISMSPVAQYFKEANALLLPYLYRDSSHMWKVLNGSIGKDILAGITKSGMVALNFYEAGARNFYTTKKPVRSLQDLKGMKIRVQENKLMMDLIKILGAIPVPMGPADIYGALEKGSIDGAENNPPSFISFKHFELCKFYILDGHTMVPDITIMSPQIMDKLSQADKDIIQQAAKDAVPFQQKKWLDKDQAALEAAKAAGVEIITLSPAIIADFQKAVQPIYETYKDQADLVARIRAVK